jgi:hypothetical protein
MILMIRLGSGALPGLGVIWCREVELMQEQQQAGKARMIGYVVGMAVVVVVAVWRFVVR